MWKCTECISLMRLISGCSTFSTNTTIRSFLQVEFRFSQQCRGILAHTCVQNCFNSTTLEGISSMNSLFKVLPRHLNGAQAEPRLCLLSYSEMDLLQVVVSLHKLRLSFQIIDWQLDVLLQDFVVECRFHGSVNYCQSARLWRRKASPHHWATTTGHDGWSDVFIVDCCVIEQYPCIP